MSGPRGSRVGGGNCIGPAVIPGGSVHVIAGGSPESPALIQYTCQCSSIVSTSPACSVPPTAICGDSVVSSAVRCSAFTGPGPPLPASGICARAVDPAPQNVNPTIASDNTASRARILFKRPFLIRPL